MDLNYKITFTKILEDDLKAIIKPQYVDQIPKAAKGTVGSILDRKDETKTQAVVCQQLDLTHLKERNVEDLSGGSCRDSLVPWFAYRRLTFLCLMNLLVTLMSSNV